MNSQVLNMEKYIEHTILRPDATAQDIKKLLDEAINYKFYGVCINPCHIRMAKEHLHGSSVKIVTVVGFPLGVNTTEVKVYETKKAIEDGADEIDMVINIGALKNQDYQTVETDISKIVEAAHGKPVKVIIETDLLTKEEIIKASQLSVNASAHFVKTSTGFVKGGVGATAENVKLMNETVSPYGLQVKASGGVKDRESAVKMIEAGAVRIGTSSGVTIVSGS